MARQAQKYRGPEVARVSGGRENAECGGILREGRGDNNPTVWFWKSGRIVMGYVVVMEEDKRRGEGRREEKRILDGFEGRKREEEGEMGRGRVDIDC